MRPRTADRVADFRAQLDDRLVHLRLDLLLEHDFSAFEDLVNMRPQLARRGIDDREFLFNTESKRVIFHQQRKKNIRRFRRFTQIISETPKLPLPLICENLHNLWTIFDCPSYSTSLSERRVTAACRNLPQLKLSHPA